ncbi:UNVERIFIED_CONTAM: hypothetical protein HDU68_001146 [Siphonaria sp. JEL0065]|nr:hypothetical protein HDU68_001146 [Siphonaria sp. JEL0065]
MAQDKQDQWQELWDSISSPTTSGTSQSSGVGFSLAQPTTSIRYSQQPRDHRGASVLPQVSASQLPQTQLASAQQPPHSNRQQLPQQASTYLSRIHNRPAQIKTPYSRAVHSGTCISSPLKTVSSPLATHYPPIPQNSLSIDYGTSGQGQPSLSMGHAFPFNTNTFSPTPSTSTSQLQNQTTNDIFQDLFSTTPSTTPPITTPPTNNQPTKEPPHESAVERQERSKKVHREAEKQRRVSLRIGFDKLKELLPASMTEGEKSWSQTRLLEYGLEYIVELKKESEEKARENIKFKEVLRRFKDTEEKDE